MVRSVTFEIRWHDTQPIYSCSFQPCSTASQLRRILEHNGLQAKGEQPERILSTLTDAEASAAVAAATAGTDNAGQIADPLTTQAGRDAAAAANAALLPMLAGGQTWRLATAGGDNNARIWLVHPNIPSPAVLSAAEAAASAAATGAGSSSTGAGAAAAVMTTGAVTHNPPRVEYMATLSRHSGVINCVRFCPRGELLATAGTVSEAQETHFGLPSTRCSFADNSSSLRQTAA